MEIYLIGSSIKSPDTANDLDLIVVSDKPVDICLYTSQQWQDFQDNDQSCEGRRVVIHPPKIKGNTLNGAIKRLLPEEECSLRIPSNSSSTDYGREDG